MNRSACYLSLFALFLLFSLPVAADLEDDPFWDEESAEEVDYMTGTGTGTGTGGGAFMMYWPNDLAGVNETLIGEGLEPLPEQELYWGGAGWVGFSTDTKFFVGLGGGGFGGSEESKSGMLYSKWSNGAGYFSLKGVYALHRHFYIEAGVSLGGGSSSVTVEKTDGITGIVEVRLRGERNYLLFRPSFGVDIRLAHWVGLLVEGGYSLTSGDWTLEGDQTTVESVDFGDGDGGFVSVMVRFGI